MKKVIIGIILAIVISGGMGYAFFRERPVHLAYMVDSKYLPYMMVSLDSAIKNKKSNTIYYVHVIAKEFNSKDKALLKRMATPKVKIRVYEAEEHGLDLSHLGRFASFSIALQKLFIADYLKEINKVLYLDADTLVLEDLSEVYKTKLADNYIAAVKDGLMYQFPEHITEIGLDWRKFYFNSGIMLLNLKQIRKDEIKNRAIIYFNTHEEVFGDQDVLNAVVKDKVIPLSYRYNCNSTFFEEKDAEFLSDFYGEKVAGTPQKVYENAAILHFAGHKPWTEYFTQSYLKALWQKYANDLQEKILQDRTKDDIIREYKRG